MPINLKITNVSKKDLLIYFGSLIFIWFLLSTIVNKIKGRTPKDLPIILYDETILIYAINIITLAIMILITLYLLISNDIRHNSDLRVILMSYMNQIYDFVYKTSYVIFYTILSINIEQIINNWIIRIIHWVNNASDVRIKRLYVGLNVVPRIFVLLIFLNDIFILKKIHGFYLSLPLLLLPLIVRFILFSLQTYITTQLTLLNDDLYIHSSDKIFENSSEFIENIPTTTLYDALVQTSFNSANYIKYSIMPQLHIEKQLCDEHNVNSSDLDYEIIEHYYKKEIHELTSFGLFILKYNKIKNKIQPWINLLIYCTYFTCWVYLLYTSKNLLTFQFPENLDISFNIENPF